jgi:hypothetical protein
MGSNLYKRSAVVNFDVPMCMALRDVPGIGKMMGGDCLKTMGTLPFHPGMVNISTYFILGEGVNPVTHKLNKEDPVLLDAIQGAAEMSRKFESQLKTLEKLCPALAGIKVNEQFENMIRNIAGMTNLSSSERFRVGYNDIVHSTVCKVLLDCVGWWSLSEILCAVIFLPLMLHQLDAYLQRWRAWNSREYEQQVHQVQADEAMSSFQQGLLEGDAARCSEKAALMGAYGTVNSSGGDRSRTPLHLAIQSNAEPIVIRSLLNARAEVDQSHLDLASNRGHTAFLEAAAQHGATPSTRHHVAARFVQMFSCSRPTRDTRVLSMDTSPP